jgi:hypothetical protein
MLWVQFDEHDPGGLNEQSAQVAIAVLWYVPRMIRWPVEICFGISPSQAPKSRSLENKSPVPVAVTIALEMIGPGSNRFAANFSAVRLNQEFVGATGGGTHVDNSLPLETLSRALPRARLLLWRDGVHRSLL